jgi:hypothetical protein
MTTQQTAPTFYTMYNVGRAKYVIKSHNGMDTHKDGSSFYGIHIFSNKQKFQKEINQLKRKGYKEL